MTYYCLCWSCQSYPLRKGSCKIVEIRTWSNLSNSLAIKKKSNKGISLFLQLFLWLSGFGISLQDRLRLGKNFAFIPHNNCGRGFNILLEERCHLKTEILLLSEWHFYKAYSFAQFNTFYIFLPKSSLSVWKMQMRFIFVQSMVCACYI